MQAMRRAWLAVTLTILWLAIGGFGVYGYGANYYQYRGFPPPHDLRGIRAGTLKTVTFHSAALGQARKYDVYLPPGYGTGGARRYGVMYLLHGAPGAPRLFIDAGAVGVAMDTLVAGHAIAPFLIVLPDGRDGSFASDTEWADTAHGRYESFVLDVVRHVDGRFPTVADRGHRVIAGNSEGAYAAANLGLRHLRTFGAFEAWSGYYRQSRTGVFKDAGPAVLRSYSPADSVRGLHAELARFPLQAFLYAGAQDPDVGQLAPFAADLRVAGAHVETRVLKGRHDWRLWRAETPAMLRWASGAMAA
jgi:enterochelin esterase-like enzyme